MVRTLKALPTLMRIGLSEAIAYRAEMLVWVFATTMPFVMLMLWTAVSETQPVVGPHGAPWTVPQFIAYYLCIFVVRQLVSAWAAWEINYEVRQGVLSMRLLRPIHPIVSYAVGNLAAQPLRLLVAVPVMVILLFTPGAAHLERDWRIWLIWLFAMLGGWLITFFANVMIGSLCLFMDSSIKLMDVWLACFFVFSGYLFPSELFPDWLRAVTDWMPFRYQVGFPTELMIGQHGVSEALALLGRQWLWAGLFTAGSFLLWRTGVKRFQAYGG